MSSLRSNYALYSDTMPLIWHVYCCVLLPICILYYHVNITHDTTYIGNGEKGAAKTKTATSQATSGTKRHCPTSQRQAQKKARCEIDETVHENLCCVCFGSYDEDIGTGREWVECSCKRWLHEDCVDEEDMDSSGKLCPLC